MPLPHVAQPVDLYVNARIRTQWQTVPAASAMAVAGGCVRWVGHEADLGAGLSATCHDLGGATVWPALGDAHTHFLDHSLLGQRVDLRGTADLGVALERVRHAAATSDAVWLQGHGWNENEWREPCLPSRRELDAITDRPAVLARADAHMLWVNSAALAAAGIGPDTPDPPDGRIDRDEAGQPTGILRDGAMAAVLGKVLPPSLADRQRALRAGQAEAHALGLASVHVMEGRETLEALQAMHQSSELTLRVMLLPPLELLAHLKALGMTCGFGDERLRLGQLKLFADGSLGSRTAWMLEPFADDPGNRGIAVLDEDRLREAVAAAHAAGWSCAIHAIGDAANRAALSALGSVPRLGCRVPDRIEHVQVLRPEDMSRFAALRVVASMQPVHVSTDWRLADRLWGARSRWSYAWRSLSDAGAVLAFGSDAPVEPLNPWAGLQVAVTRRGLDGLPADGWHVEERLSLAEALRGFTVGVAAAGGRPQGGSLAPGNPADFVVLEEDPFALPPDQLAGVRPRCTYVGGDLVFSR